jgi:hypothetical protein
MTRWLRRPAATTCSEAEAFYSGLLKSKNVDIMKQLQALALHQTCWRFLV